jgi:DNA helicase HerA-like ATPase
MLPPISANDIATELDRYERSSLARLSPTRPEIVTWLNRLAMYRVNGLAKFWKDEADSVIAERLRTLIISSWSSTPRTEIASSLIGTTSKINVYVSLGQTEDTTARLAGLFPNIELNGSPTTLLGTTYRAHFREMAIIRGLPGKQGETIPRIDPLLRAMRKQNWGLVIQATPRPREGIYAERSRLLDQLTRFSSSARHSFQETLQENRQVRTHENTSVTRTLSGENVNWQMQHLLEAMQYQYQRHQESLAVGSWLVNCLIGAETPPDLDRLAGLVLATFAGTSEARSERLTSQYCVGAGEPLETFETYLTSNELAFMMRFPLEETPGFAIHDYAAFDTEVDPPPSGGIVLGAILEDGQETEHNFTIALDDLTKHGLIVGVTGSGKSTTLMTLLENVHKQAVPFCIIEPAKTEYRGWLSPHSPVSGFRVYTLGNENVAPFRLNPFEFQTGNSPESSAVLEHIDHLKSVFNAAFILYAPMPYILETALHEIYEDFGWDLASGQNTRLPAAQWANRHQYPIFPTLTDLYHKIDPVVSRLGYGREIEQNVRAGLKTRIGALRLGAKGQMLDTAHSLSIGNLLANPTVLEMDSIGSDEEKTFLIGLILVQLYGYRRLQAREGRLPIGLQHLMVVEEAHRLLQNTSTQVGAESSNVRATAVETFANILSEMRAYGQGILIAEQIPEKLIPDVIKNTNLKIVHRLVAQDDRASLGSTINLTEAQIRLLTTLARGDAVVYAEGADHPYLTRIFKSPFTGKGLRVTNADVTGISRRYIDLQNQFGFSDWKSYGLRGTPHGAPVARIIHAARDFLEAEGSGLITRIILRTMWKRDQLISVLETMQQIINARFAHHPLEHRKEIVRWVLVLGIAMAVQTRSAERGWGYPFTDTLRQKFSQGIVKVYEMSSLNPKQSVLDEFARQYEKELSLTSGYFPGCVYCRAICTYRPEVRRLLEPADIDDIRSAITQSDGKSPAQHYQEAVGRLREIASDWLGADGDERDGIAFCAGLHIGATMESNRRDQLAFADNLIARF